MPRGSSTKKIVRVAAAGGDKRARRQRNIGYSVALAAIVVVGLLLVAFARQANQEASANDDPPKANLGAGEPGDHWHAAIAVDVCGQEQPALQDSTEPDVLGIHTHGDGVIHIHPFASSAAGERATLSKFFDRVEVEVSDSEIRTADGKIYREGETSCAGKPAEVKIAHWEKGTTATGRKPDKVFTSGFDDIRLSENYGAYTLAFVAKDADIVAPSSAANLVELGQADAGTATAPSDGQQVPDVSGSGEPSDPTVPVAP